MSGIKRYSWGGPAIHGMEALDDGDYVLHSDHKAQVQNVSCAVHEFIDWFGSSNSVNVELFDKLPHKAKADLENLRKLLKECA